PAHGREDPADDQRGRRVAGALQIVLQLHLEEMELLTDQFLPVVDDARDELRDARAGFGFNLHGHDQLLRLVVKRARTNPRPTPMRVHRMGLRRMTSPRSFAMPPKPPSTNSPALSMPLPSAEVALPRTPELGPLSRIVSPSERMPEPMAETPSSAFWPTHEA